MILLNIVFQERHPYDILFPKIEKSMTANFDQPDMLLYLHAI